jgi:hypothetical protein
LATIQTLKSGACGGPFLKINTKYFVEQPAAFLPTMYEKKQNDIEKINKEMNKITRNRGRVSKLVARPFFSQGSPHI